MPPPADQQPTHDQQLATCIALVRQDKIDEAAEIASAMRREQPTDPKSRFASALIDRHQGRANQALAALQQLATELPQNPLIRLEYAATLVMNSQIDRAIPILEELIAADPGRPLMHYWLGQAHLRSFRGPEAVKCFERMRDLAPQSKNALHPLASAYLASGRAKSAENTLRELLTTQPKNLEALSTLSAALEQQSRMADAGEVFRQMIDLSPNHPRATAGLARVLQTEGKKDQARELLRPIFEADDPIPVVISTFAALCTEKPDRQACIEKTRTALSQRHHAAQDRAALCFAAGRLLDAEDQTDAAFRVYTQGNTISPRFYVPDEKAKAVDAIIETFSAKAIASFPRTQDPSSRPIFILGMPRSGTTLVEQILAAHPDVYAAGELQELRRIWKDLVARRGSGSVTNLTQLTQNDINTAADRYLTFLDSLDDVAPHITDKMPQNFEQLGLINLLFPNAKVIHCQRSPLDTCISCYTIQFGMAHTYSNDLSLLGHAYAQYHKLMAHWRTTLDIPMLDVVYEDVVADTETLARRIVDFVGLPWNDDCLRFYEAERAVVTASVDQVRKPVYASSVGRWKRYARHLDPLRQALEAGGVPLAECDT